MKIGSKTFAEFVEERKTRFGMVILGAGKPHEDWVTGINELLVKENIVAITPCFDLAYTLSDNVKGEEGRTDLVIYFNKDAKPEIDKLVIWRLRFGGCMWTEDFVDNHSNEFKSGFTAHFMEDEDDLMRERD